MINSCRHFLFARTCKCDLRKKEALAVLTRPHAHRICRGRAYRGVAQCRSTGIEFAASWIFPATSAGRPRFIHRSDLWTHCL